MTGTTITILFFGWYDFTVENHYDFINVNRHKSHSGLEKIFMELGANDTHVVELNGEKVYQPSPNLHALFLIRHMVNHFGAAEINLRQVIDWASFVEKHTKEIDWDKLVKVIEDYHMREFFNCINAICVEDLGFPVKIFKTVQFAPSVKDRVLKDILNPVFAGSIPKCLIKRLVFKYRRWKGNAWKYNLCFGESRFSEFFSSVWSHILKPSSI